MKVATRVQGTILRADGSEETVQPKNGRDFEWEQLSEIVGGFIEIVALDRDEIMVLNEEGKLEGLPYNPAATARAERFIRVDDYIAGDVLVCPSRAVK